MKVKDLKKLLEPFDDDLDVLRAHSERGYYDVDELKEVVYCRDVHYKSWKGPHEIMEYEGDEEDFKLNEKFKGLLLD